MNAARKKSPRAPSLTLEDAVERALGLYEKEHRHEVSVDVAAQDIGYKSSKNGAALSALASLRYYGLVERPREGMLAASKDVETFKFAPDDRVRQDLKRKWLQTPPVFSELLEKYTGALPSDAAIKFELIQRGFSPAAADDCVNVFSRSVEYARYFDSDAVPQAVEGDDDEAGESAGPAASVSTLPGNRPGPQAGSPVPLAHNTDRIPVRLSGNRRAWLDIPSPLYARDKVQLKAQIDLLLTDDEDEGSGPTTE